MNIPCIFVIGVQEIFRKGMITILHSERWLRVVGEGATLVDAAESIERAAPNLIMLDLQNCDLKRDLSLLIQKERIPSRKAVVVTAASTLYEIAQCMHAGVDGILNRNTDQSEMILAIREVLEGRTYCCSHATCKLAESFKNRSLTKRELEVLQFLAIGLSNKEIAKRLGVGIGTVKTHLININAKLDVTTRTEAVIHGVQQRLITIPT